MANILLEQAFKALEDIQDTEVTAKDLYESKEPELPKEVVIDGELLVDDDIDLDDALTALKALKVDEIGLDYVDIRYLKTLIERFNGGPVGLEVLANAIGEEIMNLEDVYEPYLLQIGFIDRTPRGRVARDKAYKHLKISYQETLL